MLKKIIPSLLIASLLTTTAIAATLSADYNPSFYRDAGLEILPALTLQSETEAEINAENDVSFTIPEGIKIIFEVTNPDIEVSGEAAEKVSTEVTYSDNGRTIYLDILEDFEANESVVLNGIEVRVYNEDDRGKQFDIDTTGDGAPDSYSSVELEIRTNTKNDNLAPYPVANVNVEVNEDSHLLTWELPIDLDLIRVEVTRVETGDVLDVLLNTQYEDSEMNQNYEIRVYDGRNWSDVVAVDVAALQEEADEEEEEEVFCTQEYAPVCGVDGETYGNACIATEQNNVEIDYEGECILNEEEMEESDEDDEEGEDSPTVQVEFSDLASHWSKTNVEAMANAGIVTGNPDGTFRPDSALNRAEAAALIYRVQSGTNTPEDPEEKDFSDVSVDAWYSGYIHNLFENGVVNGNPDGTYRPNDQINRAEFLTLAINLYYNMSDETTRAEIDVLRDGPISQSFVDLQDVWYAPNVTVASAKGFVQGRQCVGNLKCFEADASITRAEATTILYNIFNDTL